MDRQSAITPCRVASIPACNHVVQRDSAALRCCGYFAGCPIHARQPPSRHNLRLRGIGEIDDAQNVVSKSIEVGGNVSVTSAGPPQAIDAEARHFEKGNLPHLCRAGDVMNTETGAELLAVCDAV